MTITYEGKTYPTIKALAQAYTVNYDHLRKLLRNEWSVEDAMKVCREKIPGRGKLYEYEGKAYRSPKRMAEALGLPWSSFSHFLLRCDSVEEAVRKCRERQENRIILWGREYQGKQEIAETFGLKYTCNGVQREHNKKLNNGLPILHKVPPKRDYGRYFCIMAEKGGTSHGGLTEKLSPFFHAKKQEVNAYGR